MRKELSKQELFQRALSKIDRRIQNPACAGHAKKALFELRQYLFEQKTDDEQRALFDELNYRLRNIDRAV
jgi:hypothetical protein